MTDVLALDDWTARRREHEAEVDALLAPHLDRRRRREKHPVEDFLFDYYSYRPGQLRRWHPGPGVVLAGVDEYLPGYRPVDGGVTLDVAGFLAKRGETLTWVDGLLRATAGRAPQFGCFGMHEWAMVYRSTDTRHDNPLRFGVKRTAEIVEETGVRCSHFDAYRFFTPAARPLNVLRPTRTSQAAMEQGGCLHANMDVYKWAYKLAPLTPSDLLLDAFRLARDIRALDMRASPYDLTHHGYEPVAVETAAGRAEYAAAQRTFARRAGDLRGRLVGLLTPSQM